MKNIIKKAVEFAEIGGIKMEIQPTIDLSRLRDYYLYHDLAEEENDEYKEAILNEDVNELAKELADEFIIWACKVGMHGLIDSIENQIMKKASKNLEKFAYSEEEAIKRVEDYHKIFNIKAFYERKEFIGRDIFIVKRSSDKKILKKI